MSKEMNILFGFDDERFHNAVINLLAEHGIEANTSSKISKRAIMDYLSSTPSCKVAILPEVVNASSNPKVARFSAEEIASMTDDRDINVILVLDERNLDNYHKGTEYMHVLLGAGIFNAVFQDGKSKAASPKNIVELILHPRTRKQAREYYGISNNVSVSFLSNEIFITLYNRLFEEKYGDTLIERFSHVCQILNKEQIADFIRRLPDDMISSLSSDKFYEICNDVSGEIIPTHVSAPAKTSRMFGFGGGTKSAKRNNEASDNRALDSKSQKTKKVSKTKPKNKGRVDASDFYIEENDTENFDSSFGAEESERNDKDIPSMLGIKAFNKASNESEKTNSSKMDDASSANMSSGEVDSNQSNVPSKEDKKIKFIRTLLTVVGVGFLLADIIVGLIVSGVFEALF